MLKNYTTSIENYIIFYNNAKCNVYKLFGSFVKNLTPENNHRPACMPRVCKPVGRDTEARSKT